MGELDIVRTRFVIPFRIKEGTSYSDIIKDLSENNSCWEPYAKSESGRFEQDIFESVIDLIEKNIDTEFNIGRMFQYKFASDTSVLQCKYCSPLNDEINFDISDAGIFVFKSCIGFLWYEVSFSNIGFENFTLFINEFKELSYKRLSLPDRFRDNNIPFTFTDEDNSRKGLLTGHWIKTFLLKSINDKIAFFSNRECDIDGSLIPDKAIIFNYAVCTAETAENNSDEYKECIYHSTNGFNRKYKTPENFSEMCCAPFDNVTCYMTTNGCSYFGFYDDSNKRFFTSTMRQKIMGDYFLMFILVLHQYYGIMKFNLCINSSLPYNAVEQNCTADSDKFLDMLNKLSSDINIFVTKSFFPSVSHIFHQNEFYYYLQERIRIKKNLENLTIGLDSMRMMQESFIRQRKEDIEKAENDRRSKSDEKVSIAFSFLSILAIFSAIADGDASVDIIMGYFGLSDNNLFVKMAVLAILGIIAVVVVSAAAFSVINYLRLNKKNK